MEAVFDFAAINRRLMRKPDPVAAVAPDYRRELIDEPAISEFRQAMNNFWQNANSRNQCQQLQGMADRAYARQIDALRASLDETVGEVTHFNGQFTVSAVATLADYLDNNETVFIGWDVECPSSS